MRLILLPITSTRSLVYFQKLMAPSVRSKPRLDDRIARKASRVWKNFENSDKRWKQNIVRWTGRLLDTIPFEENGLKTVPSINTYKRKVRGDDEFASPGQADQVGLSVQSLEPIQLVYPSTSELCPDFSSAQAKLHKFAKSSIGKHKKQMLWCVLGLPLTLPFAINPFMPNFPGMYITYRLWCNWKAMRGAQHIQHLVENNSLQGVVLPALNKVYSEHTKIDADLVSILNRIFADERLAAELEQAQRQVQRESERTAKNRS